MERELFEAQKRHFGERGFHDHSQCTGAKYKAEVEIHRIPNGGCPFGDGRTFVVVVPDDVRSLHGNIIVKAGTYEAQQTVNESEGLITLWSYAHYIGSGMWVSLVPQDWTFPGEAKRPIPEHNCTDPENLKSGVAGGIFCIVCRQEVTV